MHGVSNKNVAGHKITKMMTPEGKIKIMVRGKSNGEFTFSHRGHAMNTYLRMSGSKAIAKYVNQWNAAIKAANKATGVEPNAS